MCVMKSVGVRELRQNLSVHLRAIRDRGEPIEVTEHGHPVAVLAPLASGDEYAALAAVGRLREAVDGWDDFEPPGGPISTAGTDTLDDLREERL